MVCVFSIAQRHPHKSERCLTFLQSSYCRFNASPPAVEVVQRTMTAADMQAVGGGNGGTDVVLSRMYGVNERQAACEAGGDGSR